MSVGPCDEVEVRLAPIAWRRIREGRERLEKAVAAGNTVYGVNTGFGRQANVIIPPDKLEELQINLIRSHAAGMGDPLLPAQVKRLLVLRINVLCKGHSGIRPENVDKLLACLNSDCLSMVPTLGSVGASGDLAPLAHLALGMLGEGMMWDPTTQRYRAAAEVLADHGLEPVKLHMKEGLALINGTQFITSLCAEALTRAETLALQADVIAAVSMEALRCTTAPFDVRVHAARGQAGQIVVAQRLRSLLHRETSPSEIFTRSKHNVQDAYSIRCVPQVHGIVHDTLDFVRGILERELNAATDNPMVFENGDIVGAGNFHGEYPGKAADYLAIAVSELATISERRIERLINADLSAPRPPEGSDEREAKMPPFLVKECGLNSGFMIPQCTAAALVVENRTLVHPASCDSISTSGAQEDHVSMGAFAARKALQVVENVERVLAIELLAACQAIDFLRPLRSTVPIESVHSLVRGVVPFLEKDRYMAPDMHIAFRLVRTGAVLRAVDPSHQETWMPGPVAKARTGSVDGLAVAFETPTKRLSGRDEDEDEGRLGAVSEGAAAGGAGGDAGDAGDAAAGDGSGDDDDHIEPFTREQLIAWERVLLELCDGLPTGKAETLPPPVDGRDPSVPHAPKRAYKPTLAEQRQALKNALRYFPVALHAELAPEFMAELHEYGHIYMYRFRPTNYEMKGYPISVYPARCRQASALMLMIMNNLDPAVAQYPHELVTYGGNGSVFSNWAQYRLVMKYLSEMTERQTLVLYSGHPMGLFPSHPDAPRCVITNGMVVPNYSSRSDYERYYLMGVSQYGQMTAGSYCYIGPQGIVHGTTLTVLNAGRKYLGLRSLAGKVFLSAGLGGMSGAQAKAAVICGAVGVIAEINKDAIVKRHEQGWVNRITDDLEACVVMIKDARAAAVPISIGYHGNVVDLWRRLADQEELLVELGSDQTSCHNPFGGGYYPYQVSFEEANKIMTEDPPRFKELVQESLRVQVEAIDKLAARGMRFWDYGNSFLLECSRAGADVLSPVPDDGEAAAHMFKYPSYVEDIMGDIFSLGFGPFRWVCTSGDPRDLKVTDRIAATIIARQRDTASGDHGKVARGHYEDNHLWITQAGAHKLVVGTQARILYADAAGRSEIALAFNRAVRDGRLLGPVNISRDHHDVSGTDSPYRETSNIVDGSRNTADMAIHNVIGDSFRGATWVAIHNGGGTGWGEAINGGFGLVLDGTLGADRRCAAMLHWDVFNGVSRRAWAGNESARLTISREMKENPEIKLTWAHQAPKDVIDKTLRDTGAMGGAGGAGDGSA